MEPTTTSRPASFWLYYCGVFLRPRRTFDSLETDPRRLKLGLLALALGALLYNLVYIFLTMGGGAPSTFEPWLSIPKDVYYFYNQFLLAPSMFLGVIAASGVVQLLARLFSGKGSFEGTFSALGFGVSVASWSTLVHDLTDSFLGAIGVIDLRRYEVILNSPTFWRGLLLTLYAVYLVWFLLLFAKGIGAAQKIRLLPAFFLAVLAFLLYQGIFVLFNR